MVCAQGLVDEQAGEQLRIAAFDQRIRGDLVTLGTGIFSPQAGLYAEAFKFFVEI